MLRPLRVVIENYPEGQTEEMDGRQQPGRSDGRERERCRSAGCCTSSGTISARIRPKDFFRLAPGREVRLRYAYFVKCTGVEKDPKTGEVIEVALHLRPRHSRRRRPGRPQGQGHDPLGVGRPRHRRRGAAVRSPVHASPTPTTCRKAQDYLANLNPNSLVVLLDAKLEPSLATAPVGAIVPVRAAGLLLRGQGFGPRASWFSTGRSRCGTPGPRSRRKSRRSR